MSFTNLESWCELIQSDGKPSDYIWLDSSLVYSAYRENGALTSGGARVF
jgi:hypothetical protein